MRKSIKLLIAMLLPLVLIACSSDDEPNTKLTAQEEYDILRSMVCDPNGNIVFLPCSENSSERGMEVLDEKESTAFCKVLLNSSWDGRKTTRTIPEGYGSLTVAPSDQAGVFHTVSFNLKGIEPFTLKLASAEYFNDDNLAVSSPGAHVSKSWKCKSCGYLSACANPKPHPCPVCRKDQWEVYTSGKEPLW